MISMTPLGHSHEIATKVSPEIKKIDSCSVAVLVTKARREAGSKAVH